MNDSVDTGAIVLDDGYFMLANNSAGTSDPEPLSADWHQETDKYFHCYTYKNNPSTIKEALLKIIANAKHKIFIASFLIGDKDLMQALYEAVERLRGGVYVITALDQKSLEKGIADVEDDHEVDIKAQKKQFDDLTARGIYVRGHESCHAKFVVVDDEVALISSANLITRALTLTGENGVIIRDKSEVGRIARFFTRLWYSGCKWEVPPGKLYTVQERSFKPSPCEVSIPQASSIPGVIWTHNDESIISSTIRNVIKKAENELLLSTFSLNGMTEQPQFLIDPLRRAIEKNNLRIRFLMRARNNFETQRRDAQTLADMGVEIFADSLNHAKGVIADDSAAVLFSANFDARHGLDNGVETGVRLDGLAALKSAKRYFEYAIDNSNIRFKVNPTQKEANERLAAGWCSRWRLDDDIAVECSDEQWQEFRETATAGPVLFTCRSRESAKLLAGLRQWNLSFTGISKSAILSPAGDLENANSSNDLLKQWTRYAPWENDGREKGFCPAVIRREAK